MRCKLLVWLGVLTLGLLALACADEITVLSPDQQAPAIDVTGSGTAFAAPDVAVLSLGVEAEAESVGEARAQAAEAMEAMLAALRDGGVADEDIQTTRFSVRPRYNLAGKLEGFTVDNIVTAKIRSIDDTGQLIDDALAAGGDLTRIDNVRFTIDDPSDLEDEARQEAMTEARRKAETLAQAAGVDLGQPRSISETGGPIPVRFEAANAAYALEEDLAATPIELGELEVRVSVQVVYELE